MRTFEELLQDLQSRSNSIRKAAARGVGQLEEARGVEPLLWALGDEDSDVREAAAQALGQLGEARAVEPLTRALREGDKAVEAAAAQALGQLRGLAGAALGPLEERLQQEIAHEFPLFPEEEHVKQVCREALRQIEAALRTASAELEAAEAPAGWGTELISGDAETGRQGDRETRRYGDTETGGGKRQGWWRWGKRGE